MGMRKSLGDASHSVNRVSETAKVESTSGVVTMASDSSIRWPSIPLLIILGLNISLRVCGVLVDRPTCTTGCLAGLYPSRQGARRELTKIRSLQSTGKKSASELNPLRRRPRIYQELSHSSSPPATIPTSSKTANSPSPRRSSKPSSPSSPSPPPPRLTPPLTTFPTASTPPPSPPTARPSPPSEAI